MILHPNMNGFGPDEPPQFDFHTRYEKLRVHESEKNALIDVSDAQFLFSSLRCPFVVVPFAIDPD